MIFQRVIANGVAFDYDDIKEESECKAHASKVMGIDPGETTIERHNHLPLGYCNPCMDLEDESEYPTDIRRFLAE